MQILEVKHTLDGRRKEFPCQLCLSEPGHAVILYRLRQDVDLAGVWMPAGTLSFGHYWCDRDFNVYHWVVPDGTTAAYYVNLADNTTIDEQIIEWRDLVVDILITPDGTCQVLDEDELPADLDPALRAKIEMSIAYLLAHRADLVGEVEEASRRCMAALRT